MEIRSSVPVIPDRNIHIETETCDFAQMYPRTRRAGVKTLLRAHTSPGSRTIYPRCDVPTLSRCEEDDATKFGEAGRTFITPQCDFAPMYPCKGALVFQHCCETTHRLAHAPLIRDAMCSRCHGAKRTTQQSLAKRVELSSRPSAILRRSTPAKAAG